MEISYKKTAFLIAIIYAALLVYTIPMDGQIKDRLNYLGYANSSEITSARYISKGVISSLSNEPIWLLLNVFLKKFFLPEDVVAVIIAFSSFVTAYLVLKFKPKYFLFLLSILIFPQIIGKYVIHIRQGLAISIFLLGWFTIKKPQRWFLFALTPFIHASFFFVLFLMLFNFILQRIRLAVDIRTIAVIVIGLITGFGLSLIASSFGARQATNYEFSTAEISGLGFVFWLFIFVLYWSQGRKFTNNNSFIMTIIIFYLTTYFLIEVTGRIFESVIVLVLLAGLSLTSWRKIVFFIVALTYALLSWILRFGQPWLGWGTGI